VKIKNDALLSIRTIIFLKENDIIRAFMKNTIE